MNEQPNDPQPTSFQAGEPIPTSASIQEGEPVPAPMATTSGDAFATAEPSVVDRVMRGIKTYERWGLILGVGWQLLVLLSLMVMGVLKVGGEFLR